ncbi:MAG: dockerin type I repeat-containing protein [Ruminococcus sp.]|nr:dockerin type I repeat-containing protein [Ruminococcus sp.]
MQCKRSRCRLCFNVKTSDDYILESDNLKNVSVFADNKDVSVDTDNNDTYETRLNTDFLKGDVHKDGKINISDAVSLQKYILGKGTLTDWKSADICNDNKIDVFDIVAIRKLLIQNK